MNFNNNLESFKNKKELIEDYITETNELYFRNPAF